MDLLTWAAPPPYQLIWAGYLLGERNHMAVSLLLRRSMRGLMPLPMAVYTETGSVGVAEGDRLALESLTSLVPRGGDNQPSGPGCSAPMVFTGPCKVLCSFVVSFIM